MENITLAVMIIVFFVIPLVGGIVVVLLLDRGKGQVQYKSMFEDPMTRRTWDYYNNPVVNELRQQAKDSRSRDLFDKP